MFSWSKNSQHTPPPGTQKFITMSKELSTLHVWKDWKKHEQKW